MVEILNCRNIGEIHTNEFAGGIVGSVQLSGAESALQLHDSKNSALIQGNRSLGGILGNAMVHQGVLSLYNCENYGNITARNDYAGGILGEAISYGEIKLSHNSVRAAIQSDSFAGGIAGTLIAESGSILVEQSAAAGTVQAATAVGGCIGEVNAKGEGSTVQLFNCLAINTLSASESLGGITSHLYAEHGNASIHTSIFGGGIITGCKLTGGIAADLYASSNSASVLIETCFFTQNSASVVAHPRGGDGKETIQSSESRTEDTLRSHEQLKGLDQTIWKPDANTAHIMTPGDLPVIWEEYKYTITQNGVILEAYLGRSDIVRVPDRLGGMYVSTVAEAAFWQSHVIRVILPDSVTAIGEAAFAGCKNLERITLPASLISIGTRAFSGCEALCERRFTGSISSVLVGSENTPFQELPITRPLTIPIQHLYEDTSTAGKTTALTCYAGDFYQVTPLSIRGYKAEEGALQGIALTTDRITVVYRIGTYHLTILYQYPDGTEASPSFEGDFRFGEKYRVSSPILEGYKAEYTLIEGTMDGEDTLIIVHYTEIYENDSANGQYTLHIILFILAGLLFVCCLCYFVYRYRSITEQARLENETE